MNLGDLRTAVALTSTLEALPDDTQVFIETEDELFMLKHMRSTGEERVGPPVIIISAREMPDED